MAKKFVCVRIQSMNGVNLNAFQFEYELTWMSFFQNSVGRTYTRYGGREDHDAESHLNKRSLLRVMRQALQLHRDGKVKPQSRYEPVSKTVRTPEEIPTMKTMMAKPKNKCIHCHDVKVAELRILRDLGKVEKSMVFTYPAPSQLGLHLDPETQHWVLFYQWWAELSVLPTPVASQSPSRHNGLCYTSGSALAHAMGVDTSQIPFTLSYGLRFFCVLPMDSHWVSRRAPRCS